MPFDPSTATPVASGFDPSTAQPVDFGLRPDGTPKGNGWLGIIPRPDGSSMTEVTIGVGLDGKETNIPLIVPGLTKDEIDWLKTAPIGTDEFNKQLPPSILDKAVAHARERMAAGLSPYVEDATKKGFDPSTAQPTRAPDYTGMEHKTGLNQSMANPSGQPNLFMNAAGQPLWSLPSGEALRGAIGGETLREAGGLLQGVSGLPEAVLQGAPLLRQLAPITPEAVKQAPGQVRAAGQELVRAGQDTLANTQPANPVGLERQILGAARSVPAMATAAGVTFLTRNPEAGAFVAGIAQYGGGYAEVADRADLPENVKQAYAATTALAETLGEVAPQTAILSRAPGIVRFVGNLLGVEVGSEVATNVAQQLLAERYKVEGPLDAAGWRGLVADTVAQTILLVGAGEAPTAIARRAGVATEERLREQQRAQIEAGLSREAATRSAVDALNPANAQLTEARPAAPPVAPQLAQGAMPTPNLTPVPQQSVPLTPPKFDPSTAQPVTETAPTQEYTPKFSQDAAINEAYVSATRDSVEPPKSLQTAVPTFRLYVSGQPKLPAFLERLVAGKVPAAWPVNPELKDVARAWKLPTGGKRADLISRITAAQNTAVAAYQNQDLAKLTLKELKPMAVRVGIKPTYLAKAEIVAALQNRLQDYRTALIGQHHSAGYQRTVEAAIGRLGRPLTVEEYKWLQRESGFTAGQFEALTRTAGVYPGKFDADRAALTESQKAAPPPIGTKGFFGSSPVTVIGHEAPSSSGGTMIRVKIADDAPVQPGKELVIGILGFKPGEVTPDFGPIASKAEVADMLKSGEGNNVAMGRHFELIATAPDTFEIWLGQNEKPYETIQGYDKAVARWKELEASVAGPTAIEPTDTPADVTPRDVEKNPLFPQPDKTVQIARIAERETLTPEQANARVKDWKDYAKRIGETEDHSNEVILSLFDASGVWSQPYKDAGYTVLLFDQAHGDDIMKINPLMLAEDIAQAGKKVVGILSAPPCTSFAASGARWWQAQHDNVSEEWVRKKYGDFAAEYFDTPLEYGVTLVHMVEAIAEMVNPSFYAVENPVGRIQKEAGLNDPVLTFNPNNFGDPYTKKTMLWGEFSPDLPTANVDPTEGSRVHKLRGDNPEQKAQRSITPEGFAYAFFAANNTSKIPFKPAEFDPTTAKPWVSETKIERLKTDSVLRDALRKLKTQTGWAEEGGKIIRKSEDFNSPDYNTIVGRTQWLPKAAWWNDLPVPGYSADQVNAIIDKALAGRHKLTEKQQTLIDFLVEVADGQTVTEPDDSIPEIMWSRSPPTGDLFGANPERMADLNKRNAQKARRRGEGRRPVPADQAPRGDIFREQSEAEKAAARKGQTDIEDLTYPLAPRSEWYGEGTYKENGGRIVYMTPDQFIELAKPLQIDEQSRENIDLLKEHILAGKTLDPLMFRERGKHDGRHRAYAAKELGIKEVPVIDYRQDVKASRGGAVQASFNPGATYVGMYQSNGMPALPVPGVTLGGVATPARTVPAPEKPINRDVIMAEFQRAFGIKIYQGKPFKKRTALGFFRPANSEIRVKAHNDLEVAAHEVWHWIDHTYPSMHALYHRKIFSGELKGIAYDQSLSEGFAEFGRLYMTKETEAAQKAPQFYEAFVAEAQRLGILEKLNRVQEKMHAWYLQGAENRALSKIGTPEFPLGPRLTRILDTGVDQLLAKGFDHLQAAKVIEYKLTGTIASDATQSPYKSMRLLAGGRMIANQFVNSNTLNWDPTSGDLVPTGKGLQDILTPIADVLPEALGYFVGRRAAELRGVGKERHFAPDEIKALLALPDKVGRRRDIEKAFQEYQDYVSRLLDFAEASGILNRETRQLWEQIYKNYVPFYRVAQELGGPDVEQKGGAPFKRLTGGTRNLADILDNMVRNTEMIVRAGLRNKAKMQLYRLISSRPTGQRYAVRIPEDVKPVSVGMDQVAQILKRLEDQALQQGGQTNFEIAQALNVINSIQTGSGESPLAELEAQATFFIGHQRPGIPDKDFYLANGKPVWFQIGDPLLWDMIVELNTVKPLALAEQMMSLAKRSLTRGVTMAPTFQIRNFVRDTVNSMTLAKNLKLPVIDALISVKDVYAKSPEFQDFLNNGGGFGFAIHSDSRQVKLHLERVKHAGRWSSSAIIDTPSRILEGYDTISQGSELANRLAEFKRAKQAGFSSREAAYRSREIGTDFGMRGSSSLYRMLANAIPFWSARMQGLYRNERELFELDGRQTPAALRGEVAMKYALRSALFVTLPSLLLYLLNKDEDWYKEQNPATRDLYWLLPGPKDTLWAIPKPFETGMLFGTMAERMWQYMETQNSKTMMDALAFMVVQTFSMDGIPQLIRPIYDLKMNKDFRGMPIIPERLQDVDPREQFTPYTSRAAIAAGKAFGVSPIKLEYLARAYFGYMGGYGLMVADALLGAETGGQRPTMRLERYPVIDGMLKSGLPSNTSYEQSFYDLAEKITETVQTVRKMKQEGNADGLAAYMGEAEQKQLFAMDKVATEKKAKVAEINVRMRQISFSKSMNGDEKRRQLDALQRQKNELLKQVMQGLGQTDIGTLRNYLEWNPTKEKP